MKLREATELIVDSEHKTAPKQDTGYPYIRTPNVGEGRLILDDVHRISEESYEEWTRRAVPQKDDLILAREAPVGNVAIVQDGIQPVLGQRTVLIRPDKDKVNPVYLVYLLLGNEIQDRFYALSTGSTVAHLNMSDIRDLDLPKLPSREVQDKIASTLSAFDDLIKNNSRRIEILEEMARRIYREWFVHFRYPGHEDDEPVDSGTDLGEIPEGWDVKQIKDIVNRSNEGLKPIDYPDEEFYYYSFSAYDEGQRPEIIKGEEIKSRKYVLDDNAVIISKLNPRIPRIWYAKPKTDKRCLTSTEFLILNGVDRISNAFVYSLLSSQKFYGRFKSLTGGTSTSHQRVKPKDFRNMKIALPEEDLLDEYQEKAGQLFDLAHNLREKNEKLKETRDLLLPKLISGKIDVEEIKYELKENS